MKFNAVLKAAALAAILASASAQAAPVTVAALPSSTGVLKLSDDVSNAESSVIGAFGVAGIQITAAAPATLQTGNYPPPDDFAQFAWISAPVSTVTYDDTTGQVLSVQSQGGLIQTVAAPNAASRGGNITVQNIRVDLVGKTLYADVSGANGLASSNIAFFNFSTLSGASTITPGVTANTTLSGLTLTAEGKQALITGLGLRGIGLTTLNNLTDFGSLESSITVPVPEPSTYALMGLGLAGAAWVARRRKQS